MPYDALIFDLDGTLWDACPASAKGWNKALQQFGIQKTITGEDLKRVSAHHQCECIELLLPWMMAKYPTLFDVINAYEEEAIKQEGGALYSGVFEGMQKLSKKYALFIVSNCSPWYLNLFFQFCPIQTFLTDFDCYGASEFPKHTMISRLQQKYSLKNPVYIGDTLNDFQSAQRAGASFIHAAYGFENIQHAQRSFSSFCDLVTDLCRTSHL